MLSLWHKIQRRFTLDFWIRRYLLLREKLEGVDFSEIIEVEELGLDPSLASHSAPSGNKYLRNVLNQISISNRDAIIDIGSGKGSAMRIMLEFPFHKVDGVELSSQVAEIAQKNFNKLKIPRNRYELFVMDAANSYVLKVKGRSMIEDGIFDGDFVIVERNPSPKNGDIVVALLDNAYATLKRFYREANRSRLQPANSTMQPIIVNGDINIQGVVRGVIRKFATM